MNLNALISHIAREEGGKRSAGGTAQVAEILGILGRRWRGMSPLRALAEFRAIRTRAGRGRSAPPPGENTR